MGVVFKDRVMLFLVIASAVSVTVHTLAALQTMPGATERFMQMAQGSVPVTLAMMAAQYVTRVGMKNIVGYKIIGHQPGMSAVLYEAKVDRFGAACFKACYWTVSTVLGYIILRDEDWMPKELGGSGKASAVWDGYGYQQHSNNLIWFYVVSFAYQLSDFTLHVMFEKRRPDFVEMLLHHSVAIALILTSFMSDFVRVGALTIFLHGISDIWVYFSKALVDTNFKLMNILAFASLYFTYAWCRLYVFPHRILRNTWSGVPLNLRQNEAYVGNWTFFNFLLCTLFLLHVYWFTILTRIAMNLVWEGKRRDLVANLTQMDLQELKKKGKKTN